MDQIPSYKDKSVLVAETEPFLRSIIVDILRTLGFSKIYTASDCPKALSEIRTWFPDALILDWNLAGGGGAKLTRWIRTSDMSPNRELSIIMVTGDTSQETIVGARDAGIDEIIVKPVVPLAVKSRIAQVFKARRKFVQSNGFVGPDRRRRAPDTYQGKRRRLSDRLENRMEGVGNVTEQVTRILETMAADLAQLDVHERDSVMTIYHCAHQLWDEGRKLGNTPVESVGNSMLTYIQAIGNSGRLDGHLLMQHVQVLGDALKSNGASDEKHSKAMKELDKLVAAAIQAPKVA